jgi:TetR/AcrR family transcriptional repressor of nem operon
MRYGKEEAEQYKDNTRKRLLSAATSAFWSLGPQRVSVTALMARLGMTHGGFYLYFQSKEELVAHSINEMFERSLDRLESARKGRCAAAALARYVDSNLSKVHGAAAGCGCALPAVATDVARLGTAERALFTRGTQLLNERVAGLIRDLGKSEEEARVLASSLLSEMSGAVLIARALGPTEEARRTLSAARMGIKSRLGIAE